MPTTTTISHSRADILYDGLHSGAIGGSVVALFFFVFDAFRFEPLFTPTLMGSVLFDGAAAAQVTAARFDVVARYSLVHFVTFGALGMLLSFLVHEVEIHARRPAEVIFVGFVVFEALFFMAAFVLMPGVTAVLGKGTLFVANLLAAGSMGLFIFGSHHPGAWRRWVTEFVRE